MGRRIIYTLALLLCALPAWGRMGVLTLGGTPVTAPGSSYLYDFEETGTPTGITVTASTPNFDATPGSDMEGSQSASFPSCTNTAVTTAYFSTTDSAEMAVEFEYAVGSAGDSFGYNTVAYIATSGGSARALLYVRDNGTNANLVVEPSGGSQAQTVGTFEFNTTIRIRLYYKKGTGSNAIASVAFVVGTGDFPTSGNNFASATNGTSQLNAGRVYLNSNYSSAASCLNSIFDAINITYY